MSRVTARSDYEYQNEINRARYATTGAISQSDATPSGSSNFRLSLLAPCWSGTPDRFSILRINYPGADATATHTR